MRPFQVMRMRNPSVVSSGPAHRYWRINVSANGGDSVLSVVELEMYEGIYGPNVCSGGSASASTTNSGNATLYGPANAFDGTVEDYNTAKIWAASTSTGWIQYDFGSGVTKNIVAIGMHGRVDTWKTQMPTAFTVQYSDDGSTWTTKWSVSGLTWTAWEFKRFVDPGETDSHTGAAWPLFKIWRLDIPRSVSGSPALAEMEIKASPGGADQCSGGTPTAGSTYPGLPASNLFDNNNATIWSGNAGVPEWVQYEWSSGVTMGEWTVRGRNDGFESFTPSCMILRARNSTSDPWTTVSCKPNVATGAWSPGQLRTYTDPYYV